MLTMISVVGALLGAVWLFFNGLKLTRKIDSHLQGEYSYEISEVIDQIREIETAKRCCNLPDFMQSEAEYKIKKLEEKMELLPGPQFR